MSNGYVDAGQVSLRTASGLQGLRGQRQQFGVIEDQRQAKRSAQTQRAQALQEGAQLLQSDDSLAVAQWAIKNPELRETFTGAVALQDQFAARPRLSLSKDVLSGKVDPKTAYQERVNEIESKGGDASKLKEAVNTKSDAELMKMAEKDLAMFDPKSYENYAKTIGGRDSKISSASPKDFTVESLSAYEQSGDIGDLVRFLPKTLDIEGVPYQQNEITQQWEPVVDVKTKQVSDDAKALADIEADKKSRTDFATQQGKWRSNKSKFRTKIASAKNSQKLMEETANQIKNNLSGWSTSHGASLARLPGTDARKLSGLINTLRAHSAFSTLIDLKESGGTLGAVSGSELELLESKLGALDQKGDVEEMRRVIDQILASNQSNIDRLQVAYKEDNKMYSTGFDEMIKEQQKDSPQESAQEAPLEALNYLRSNPQAADQFKAKYGYLPEGF